MMKTEDIHVLAATIFAAKMIEVFGAEACSKITAESLEEGRILVQESIDWTALAHDLCDIYEELLTGDESDDEETKAN